MMDRRRFVALGTLGSLSIALGCARSVVEPNVQEAIGGRLSTRWKKPTKEMGAGIKQPLGLGSARDGYVRTPAGYRADVPAPFALLLHGAGRDADEWIGGFPVFDALGLVVLSVDSRSMSWDLRYGPFGPDVAFINTALAEALDRCNVDPARMAIAGFSDGASYALSLGLTNGDVFSHVLAFSPGYMETDGRHGKPPVFLSHGSGDPVLPVEFSRELVLSLRADGYSVTYQEFEGGHTLPYAVGQQGFGWLVDGTSVPALSAPKRDSPRRRPAPTHPG